jgi:hypothetical protein
MSGDGFPACWRKTQQSDDKSKTTSDSDLLMLKVKAIQRRNPVRETTE